MRGSSWLIVTMVLLIGCASSPQPTFHSLVPEPGGVLQHRLRAFQQPRTQQFVIEVSAGLDAADFQRFIDRSDYRTHKFGHMLLVYYTIESWMRSWTQATQTRSSLQVPISAPSSWDTHAFLSATQQVRFGSPTSLS